MSLTLKLGSLLIRTAAKPVGNSIKATAREREGFRRYCIGFAQWLHRVDMNMRLGILHDAAAQERMRQREAQEEAAKKKAAETPTVLTEAQQKSHDAELAQNKGKESKPKDHPKPKIRPLSDARAIDLGANFIAEAFVFMVAAGVIVFERWWSNRRENKKDEHVVERLEALETQNETIIYLEAEVQRLRADLQAEEAIRLGQQKSKVEKGAKPKQTVA